jgi:hypothetical protein
MNLKMEINSVVDNTELNTTAVTKKEIKKNSDAGALKKQKQPTVPQSLQ